MRCCCPRHVREPLPPRRNWSHIDSKNAVLTGCRDVDLWHVANAGLSSTRAVMAIDFASDDSPLGDHPASHSQPFSEVTTGLSEYRGVVSCHDTNPLVVHVRLQPLLDTTPGPYLHDPSGRCFHSQLRSYRDSDGLCHGPWPASGGRSCDVPDLALVTRQ